MTERLADVVGRVEEDVLTAGAREPGTADRPAPLRMVISMQALDASGDRAVGGRSFDQRSGGRHSDCRIFDGRASGGRIFDGRIFGGRIFDGRVFGGRVFGGRVFGGRVFGGRVFGGRVFGGRVFALGPTVSGSFGADASSVDLSNAKGLGANNSGANRFGAGAARAVVSVGGSFAVGAPVSCRTTPGQLPTKSSEPGADVAVRAPARHHPLTVVTTAAARPEGDDLARAAAQAALVLGVGHCVTRMLDERLRSCRRTGPTPHPPTAPPTPSGPTPLP